MEEKQRGGGVEREMLQLWGNKTTEQHLTCGLEEGGHEACGGCTQWHCYKGVGGGGVAADKVWRNGSFPPILPLGSLDTEHSC